MAKKVRAMLKVQAPAGKATAAPPVGPALGQHGINIMEFIKAFNERTADLRGYVVPAEIIVYEDRSDRCFRGSGTPGGRTSHSLSRSRMRLQRPGRRRHSSRCPTAWRRRSPAPCWSAGCGSSI